MEDQTQHDRAQAPEGSEPKQDVFAQDPTATDAALTEPADPAEAPVLTDSPVGMVDDTTDQPDTSAETAQAAADANDNSTRETVTDDDESVGQLVAAQMARARNALAHMEEAAVREVHAALDEIKGLLGIK